MLIIYRYSDTIIHKEVIFDGYNNALHMNVNELVPHSSLGETTSQIINRITTETSFNHKYVILYTCNQLTNGGSVTKADNILKMMNGTRLLMGYASVMYLDSREATAFTNGLSDNYILGAYISATKVYQVQRASGDFIARIAAIRRLFMTE